MHFHRLLLLAVASAMPMLVPLWIEAGDDDVRPEAAPHDAVERFTLLLPGGPLIVEATITIDGEPFRLKREALIDEMLSAGDTDQDGALTWQEALRNPRFTFGRVFNGQQPMQYVDRLDQDQNGQVDRAEAHGFLDALFQGPSFIVTGSSARQRRRVVVS